MKDLIIGDCHFGIKSNSIQWLEYQILFFKEQIIPELQKNKYDRVIFLGDLYDIRYSINQYIGYEVKCMIRYLADNFPGVSFYFIAGNHDYYSPDEKYNQYNFYNLLFGYEFTAIHPNVHIVENDYLIVDKTIFCSWYATENIESYKKIIEEINQLPEEEKPTIMYCHSDLSIWNLDERLDLKPKDLTVISGHIHNKLFDQYNKLYNVGSIFAINFNDVNNSKYYYRFDTDKNLFEYSIENYITPKFKYYKDEEIFSISELELKNCYVKFFINSENINKLRYTEVISYIKKNYEYEDLKVQIYNDNIIENIEGVEFNTNITDFIENNIPCFLKGKFEYIKGIVNQKDKDI